MFTTDSTLPGATRRAHLTPEHEETIKATLPVVGANIGTIAKNFYSRMFTAHPELLRDTFNRGNQRSGEQQKALAASVATFATMLVDPNGPDPVEMLSRIAHKHVSLGITADQYDIVHTHLFAAIGEVLGDAVTPEVAEAWDEVYWLMAKVLIGEEDHLYATASVTPGDVFRTARLVDSTVLTTGEEGDAAVAQLTFEVPDDPGAFVPTRPGQYTSLGVVMPDGARQLRQYSLVDWDEKGFTIAVQRDGEVSTQLLDVLQPGATVDATLPAGDLVLTGADEPVVLVSSGIGSTPMTGMLSALVALGATDVTVIHADSNEASYAQRTVTNTYVNALREAGTPVRNVVRYRDEGESVDLVAIADESGIPFGANWFLCGGNSFLQDIRGQLADHAGTLQPAALHFELFSPNDWLVEHQVGVAS
ncbi:MAG TPA: hemin transporter [Candidatus Corynebacterium avicola]|uniref:nitric oxide dioxygenase n=1 Tax=Candidatus Corynebacterium avicola TaxID=2838527 RepID=A0A9D1RSN0_9CORY|nr:hemin transporter [Candidatus Corynebacterium avicola]